MKIRQSNLELLRIVAMFLVLVVHANFLSLKEPIFQDELNYSVIFKCFVQSFSIICVNVFILISGYFGISIKLKSIVSFIFQCLFFSFFGYFVMFFVDHRVHNWGDFLWCFSISKYNWFIVAYLGLLMLSPVFNSFIENHSRKQLSLFIVIFFLFSTWFGFLLRTSPEFRGGYSFISFALLYCIGRFIRLNSIKLFMLNKYFDFSVYLFLTVLNTICAIFILLYFSRSILPIYSYNNPIVILSSISFFLFFTKLNFQSRGVNWVAASAFAVFLLHVHPLILPYYCEFVQSLYMQYATLSFVSIVLLFMICIFITAILIDKCRLWLFCKLYAYFEYYISKWYKMK